MYRRPLQSIVRNIINVSASRATLGKIDAIHRKESMRAMTETFYAAIFGYDEMQFIDTLDGEDLLLTGEVKWRPLLEENAQSILKVPSSTYNDAGL
ncbi:ubiquinol-cytochrome-c reductase complex assembly factor 1-like isoform X2 [Oncorhynchus mykiss]|uniref:ubiquinol-cytochrome-c reductase complex assembly factor 1-like isoform X2 n=1 Tax=Oncorhynchus mykiss TaxID=8022 RepID=UPI0018787BB7|nr:ubiquinol-cytochrome-c reductase complex assembly factor 1-like isoform X2 [Oncorhynchus mykiss]